MHCIFVYFHCRYFNNGRSTSSAYYNVLVADVLTDLDILNDNWTLLTPGEQFINNLFVLQWLAEHRLVANEHVCIACNRPYNFVNVMNVRTDSIGDAEQHYLFVTILSLLKATYLCLLYVGAWIELPGSCI